MSRWILCSWPGGCTTHVDQSRRLCRHHAREQEKLFDDVIETDPKLKAALEAMLAEVATPTPETPDEFLDPAFADKLKAAVENIRAMREKKGS